MPYGQQEPPVEAASLQKSFPPMMQLTHFCMFDGCMGATVTLAGLEETFKAVATAKIMRIIFNYPS